MRARWPALVVILLASFHTALADTYPRQPGVDAQHYAFALRLSDQSPRIEAEARVRFRLVAVVPHLELDLISPSGDKGMTVSRVTANDAPIAFTHAKDRLRLSVPRSLRAGQDVAYTIAYGGVPMQGLHVLKKQSLQEFFAQWLQRPGVPRLDGSWRYDASTQAVVITVTQTQNGDAFQFPLDVRVTGAAGETPVTARLIVDAASATRAIAVPFVPSSVTLDPLTTLLADIGAVRTR